MDGAGLLVYDGDCAFCQRAAGWVTRHARAADVLSWQEMGDDLAGMGLTEADARSAAWWVDGEGRRFRGHLAVAEALVAAGGPWRVLGRTLRSGFVSRPAGSVYRLIALNRHRLPGSTCGLPRRP